MSEILNCPFKEAAGSGSKVCDSVACKLWDTYLETCVFLAMLAALVPT